MRGAKATVYGAVSIVNAIATGMGATLGTQQKTTATLKVVDAGKAEITVKTNDKNASSRLVDATVRKMVSKKMLEGARVAVEIDTNIPTGYGLKSSSSISSAVALACAKVFGVTSKASKEIDDQKVLSAGVNASIETRVSITGAYDDACGCYYGGLNVTDNYKKKVILHKNGPKDMYAVIFVPKSRKRGRINMLKTLDMVFDEAWKIAARGDYKNAMILNGLATSAVFGTNSSIITDLLTDGKAIAASTSGNGPAIAAIAKQDNIRHVKSVFGRIEGRIITTKINNKKASVHEV